MRHWHVVKASGALTLRKRTFCNRTYPNTLDFLFCQVAFLLYISEFKFYACEFSDCSIQVYQFKFINLQAHEPRKRFFFQHPQLII